MAKESIQIQATGNGNKQALVTGRTRSIERLE